MSEPIICLRENLILLPRYFNPIRVLSDSAPDKSTRLIKKMPEELNAAPEKVMFPKGTRDIRGNKFVT